MTPPPELAVARAAAEAGGDVAARYFRDGVTMRSKDVANLVSDADVEAEHAIAAVIRTRYPDHAILGEEAYQGDATAEHLWVVDPIDGTNNFAHAIPHFAVSVAYYHQGVAQVGVVYNPITGDWSIAARGQGAEHNGRPARVQEATRLDQVIVGVGFYYDRGAMMEATLNAIRDLKHQQIHGIRRFGTASLDLVAVGLGRFGAYFEYELSPWDFAAGRLFVEEAGGSVTDARGGPLPLGKSSVLASNGALHASTLAIVRKHHPGGPG